MIKRFSILCIALAILSLGLFFWPGEKTAAHVAALSSAVLLGLQFWLPAGGGTHVLWYLPLVTVTLMRGGLSRNG